MNHKAIYKLYPNVVVISEEFGVFDKDNNKVEINIDAVNAWVDPEAYKYKRQQAYPSIADQLDILYHSGFDAWKSAIKAVKEEFPK